MKQLPFLWAFYVSTKILRDEDARRYLNRYHGKVMMRPEIRAVVYFPKPLCWVLSGLHWVNGKTYRWYKPYFWLMQKYLDESAMIPNKWRILMPLHVFVYWVADDKRAWVRELPTVERTVSDGVVTFKQVN